MGKESIVFILFGIILFSGIAYSDLIDASSIQQVNGQLVFANISCYACEGASCAQNVSALPVQACNMFGADCVTTFNFNGPVAARGCSNLLSAQANATCISEQGQLCFKCASPLCNVAMKTDEYIDCYQCDSYSNSECLWNINDSSVTTTQCYESCIVTLLPKSANDNSTWEIYRGCGTDSEALGIEQCTSAQNCWSCNGSKCNNFNEPSNRLSCNFCTNTSCVDTIMQPCLSYRADDKCAYVLNNDSSVSYLTCASSFDPSKATYLQGLGILSLCNGANCNTLNSAPHPSMNATSCVSCDSENNVMCATNPSNITTTVECEDINKMCYSRISYNGYTVRGCLSDQSEQDFMLCYTESNTTNCAMCNASNCNNQLYPANRISCYVCNSKDNQNCESKPSMAQVCPIYNSDEKCVQYKANSTIYRGCSSQHADYCTGGDMCASCSTSACNNKDFGSGSATVQLTSALLFASLFVFLLQGMRV